jgi:hypothetical protein
MLKIECNCGQKGYLEYMYDENDMITLSLDIDTMNVNYSEYSGLQFKCPKCKKTYDIIRVQ